MTLPLVERLLVFAVIMAILATLAVTFTIYLWVTEATDKDEVQRFLMPVLPGMEPGETPSDTWMSEEVLQGVYRGLPNPKIVRLEYTIQTGTNNYPVMSSGHLLYTCPEKKRCFIDYRQVFFGQKPTHAGSQDYFLALDRPGVGTVPFNGGVNYSGVFMDPGDGLYLFGNPPMQLLNYVIECDITNATPRTYLFQGSGPFTYIPPAGHQMVSYMSPDIYFVFVMFYHHHTAVPGGSLFEVFRQGEKINELPISSAAVASEPVGGAVPIYLSLNDGESVEFQWPAALDGFITTVMTAIEIPV